MRRVALRGIRSHLGRFLMSVVAVLLGVAFVAGTFSLRAVLSTTFEDLVETSLVGAAYVRGATTVGESFDGGGSFGEQRNAIDMDLAERAAQVEGVDAAVPELTGPIVVVGADGTAVLSGGGAPSFAYGLHPDEPSTTVVDGRAPTARGEIALESSSLEASGLAVGDATRAVIADTLVDVEVVAEVAFDAPVAGATIAFLDLVTAADLYAPDGMVPSIALHAPDLDEEEVVERVRAELTGVGDVEVVSGEDLRAEATAQIREALGFISTFLLVFAAIALFVGGFIIANTFQMLVRQRQRELAMLRAVGASPAQVFASILVQAGVVGVLGSGLGVVAGVGLVSALRVVFARFGMELSGDVPVDGSTVGVSVLVGTVVSLLAAAVPARRAALTPPVEAMRDDVPTDDRGSRVRALLGGVLLAGGATAVVGAALGWVEDGGPLLGVGAAAVLAGALLVSPAVVPAALGLLAAPAVAAVRPLGGLARGNVTRNPRRTASTAGALMIGMALVGAAAVLAASTQASTRGIVEEESTADFLLQSATRAVPAEVLPAVEQVDGVAHVEALNVASIEVDGDGAAAIGLDGEAFDTALRVELVDGSLGSVEDGEVLVQRSRADDEGWAVGDSLELAGAAGSREVRIGGVIDSTSLGVPVVVPTDLLTDLVPAGQVVVDTVFVVAQEGTDLGDLRAGLTDVVRPYVVVTVMDGEEFADSIAEQVDQVLVILYALLGLSVVIAVLGIVNTLALSITERTREIGLLRAVGLGRLQLASVVTLESVLTAVFGTVVGVAIGAGLAAAMPSVFADEGLSTLAVPWSQIGLVLGLAVVVGVVAALWPAVRAARLDVLDAVSYE